MDRRILWKKEQPHQGVTCLTTNKKANLNSTCNTLKKELTRGNKSITSNNWGRHGESKKRVRTRWFKRYLPSVVFVVVTKNGEVWQENLLDLQDFSCGFWLPNHCGYHLQDCCKKIKQEYCLSSFFFYDKSLK